MADDIARLGYEIDSAQALTAGKNLDRMNASAVRAAGGADRLMTGMGRASSGVQSLDTWVKANTASINAMQIRMRSAASAVAAMDAPLDSVAASANNTAAAFNRVRVAGTNMQATVGNQFAQLNDVVVTSWGGMNPALIGMQQGMQMAQGFAGQSLPQAMRTLGGAFMTLLNPTTLLTVGIVAGGAALIQWGMSAIGASSDAETFSDSMDGVADAFDRYRDALNRTERPMTSLIDRFGTQAQAMQRNLELQARLERARAIMAIAEGAELVRDEFSDMNWHVERLNSLLGTSEENGIRARRSISSITSEFGLSVDEARSFVGLMNQMGQDDNPAVMAESLERMVQIMLTAQESGGNINTEMLDTLRTMLANAEAARELAGALADASTNAAGIQIPLGMTFGTGWIFDPNSDMPQPPPGRRRSGGGQSEAERIAEAYKQRLEALRVALQTEREVVDEWYAINLADLNARRAAELLGEAEHNEMRLALEREYQERLIAMRGSYQGTGIEQTQKFMGDMATALQGGNERMQRIASVFAGVEATINAYRAFNQVLADPTLPWFAKIPSAIGVLAAGLRTVQAIRSVGGSGGGASAATSASSSTTVSQGSSREVLVNLQGPDWAKDMFKQFYDQIYEAAGDGKVIIK